ncbi:MAG: hypothetical protein Q7R86_00195 [bacterium]|nr:hypothetical protein [bacterium]
MSKSSRARARKKLTDTIARTERRVGRKTCRDAAQDFNTDRRNDQDTSKN